MIMMCQCRFSSSVVTNAPLWWWGMLIMREVGGETGDERETEAVWETPVLSSQFFSESETAL